MPQVPFESMPDDARLWVFGARAPLDEVDTPRLLRAVDLHLMTWTAHGAPLTCSREFLEDFFLVVAVDERASDASGCSIDGLFKVLQKIEDGIGTSMVGGGLIFFRDAGGFIHCVTRAEFGSMASLGDVGLDTKVFDLTITTAGDFRARFETTARKSWHVDLLPDQART